MPRQRRGSLLHCSREGPGLASAPKADGGRVHAGQRVVHVVKRRRPRRTCHHAGDRGRGAEQREPGWEGAGLLVRLGSETVAPRRPPRIGLLRAEQHGRPRRDPEASAAGARNLRPRPRGRGRDHHRKCVTLASTLRGAVLRGSARRRGPLPWRRRLRPAKAGLRGAELRHPRHRLLLTGFVLKSE